MRTIELFSRRKARERGDSQDVYIYDRVPYKLRVQVVHILDDAIGESYNSTVHDTYSFIEKALSREFGVLHLMQYESNPQKAVFDFILQKASDEQALDIIELSFKVVDKHLRKGSYQSNADVKIQPDEAIIDLNIRFKENGVGYRFESGELIRIDSEYVHAEAVKPVLRILRAPGFSGANAEFLSAHEHYKNGRSKESLVDCLKALESTIKAVCKIRNWKTQPADNAKTLIGICFTNNLLPPYLECQFSSMRNLLESGVPTIRNKNGGHGQGADVQDVPEHLVRYTLNLTASNILFLVEAHQAKR
jgi:hypothetical protein